MGSKCVFLDRDRTIIEDPGYLTDPDAVKLLPGVELALRSFAQAGFKLVVVTNQSAIARGLLTEDGLEQIHGEMRRQLSERGVELDAIYYCPYHTEGSVEKYTRVSADCKPSPGMLLRASKDLQIDLQGSWMVGDAPRDIEAGQRAGCRTVRVRLKGDGEHEQDEDVQADFTVRNLIDAARVILRESGAGPAGAGKAFGSPATISAGAGQFPGKIEAPIENMTDSQVLHEILRHVRQNLPAGGEYEFSATRLLGAIFQIFAIAALVWGLVNIPGATTLQINYTVCHIALTTAGVLQLAALTFFILSRQR
ncbi:MAG: HAD family hydrolase [Phycisphaerae bacterium]|nr:HAD family hydrolase [Phycisphaerae bacterium]